MTTEEKAKAYDEALEKARCYYEGANGNEDMITMITTMFPKLKESEDERIRKELLDMCKTLGKSEWIAWLENQGEQKPADKPKFKFGDRVKNKKSGVTQILGSCIEDVYEGAFPFRIKDQDDWELVDNFKVGQWIVATGKCVYLIVKIDGSNVTLVDTNGYEYVFDVSSLDDAHEWTIEDAKAGDVLFTSSTASNEIFMFKSIDEKGNVKCHFAYDSEDGFREGKYHFIGGAENCKPATKEQRDLLLFQKLNAEKKKLEK